MRQNKPRSLLISSDGTLINALNYLFSVVLKHEFVVVEGWTDAKEFLARNRSLTSVFVHLPEYSGEALELSRLAKSGETEPVVMVLHSGEPDLEVSAFFAGADDVMVWPCSLRELAVRLFVRLGRSLDNELLQAGNVSWDTESYIADRAGLTTSEAQVMHVLYLHDGEIVTRDDLSFAVDARPWRYGDRKFDVHIAKMRKKLSDSFGDKVSVSTIRSLGYRLVTVGSNIFEAT